MIFYLFLSVILGNLLIGVWVLFHGFRNKVNLSFACTAFIVALWSSAVLICRNALSPPSALLWSWIASAIFSYVPIPFLCFFSFFPKEDDSPKTYQMVAWLWVASFFAFASFSNLVISGIDSINGKFAPVPGPIFWLFTVYFLGFIYFAFYRLLEKHNSYKGLPKQQIAYVLMGFFFGFTPLIMTNLLLPLYGFTRWVDFGPLPIILTVGVLAYAITKYRLMNISIVISRAFAEVLSISIYSLVYLSLVRIYKTQISDKINLLFLVWTIVYGIFFGQTQQRVRIFIQTTSDKLFLHGQYDYYQELSDISSRIVRSLSLDNILKTLHHAFYDIIEVASYKIYLSSDFARSEVQKYLSVKEPVFWDTELILPCLIENLPVAIIVLGKKLSEDPYTDEDLKLLRLIANQTAVALDHIRICDEMLKTQKQLLMADKLALLGKIAAGIAHEIKNPLAAIKGMSQAVELNTNDPEFITDFKAVIPKEIDRLNGLVDNLACLGKAPKLQLIQFDLNNHIDNALKLFENRCQKNNICIIKNFSPLPEIKANPEQLTQVLANLILNAIQAMPQGGELRFDTRTRDNKIMVEISDSGLGIPENKIKDIFEPFFSTKEGMGLGLAISYKIIKDHKGDIEVKSMPGKGTRFIITLPH